MKRKKHQSIVIQDEAQGRLSFTPEAAWLQLCSGWATNSCVGQLVRAHTQKFSCSAVCPFLLLSMMNARNHYWPSIPGASEPRARLYLKVRCQTDSWSFDSWYASTLQSGYLMYAILSICRQLFHIWNTWVLKVGGDIGAQISYLKPTKRMSNCRVFDTTGCWKEAYCKTQLSNLEYPGHSPKRATCYWARARLNYWW